MKGCVTYPNYNHFPLFINKLDIKNIINELELNKNYYYNDNVLMEILRCVIEMIFMKYRLFFICLSKYLDNLIRLKSNLLILNKLFKFKLCFYKIGIKFYLYILYFNYIY